MGINRVTIKAFLVCFLFLSASNRICAQEDTLSALKKRLAAKKICAGAIMISLVIDSVPTATQQLYIQSRSKIFFDSLQANKNKYRNKPLSVLLYDFILPIRGYKDAILFNECLDTLQVEGLQFDFYEYKKTFGNLETNNRPGPSVYIKFEKPIPVPKTYLKKGGQLDVTAPWHYVKAEYYSAALVADYLVVE